MKCFDSKIKRMLPLYEAGLLDEKQTKQVEDHLLNCQSCAEDLYTMLPAIEVIKQYIIDSGQEQIAEEKWIFIQRWAAPIAAAVITFVLGLAVWFGGLVIPLNPANTSANIYDIFQGSNIQSIKQAYEKTACKTYKKALNLYKKGYYKQALAICQKNLKNKKTEFMLLAAKCYLALKSPSRALETLEANQTKESKIHREDILWLKAQCYLQLKQSRKCIETLDKLKKSSPRYSKQAQEILKLLTENPSQNQ